jgi:hypothetical protein
MSAAGPPQGANSAPAGGSDAAKPRAWGDHRSAFPGEGREWIAWAVALVGAVLFAFAAWLDRRTAFESYLYVWWFLLGIPVSSIAMLAVHNMTGGGWGELVRPWLETAACVLPLVLLLSIPLFFVMQDLYAWVRPDVIAADAVVRDKGWYLSFGLFVIRKAVYLAVWLVAAHRLRKWSFARSREAPLRDRERLRALSAIGLLLYAVTVTFAAVDWIMSLTPHWYSTTFGLLVGIGQTMTAFAFVIACAAWQYRDAVDAQADLPSTGPIDKRWPTDIPGLFQDLGNLVLMFVMTWAYLAFTQYLIIWAEDLPNEIGWYLPRVNTSWHDVALFLIAVHFAVPFLVLLSRRAKRIPRSLGALAALLLFAHLVDGFWLVVPTFRPQGITLAWSDLFAVAALGGLFVAVFQRMLRVPSTLAGRPGVEVPRHD